MNHLAFFFSTWAKFFFLFTPFFALTMFLSVTVSYSEAQRRRLALQVTRAAGILCLALFFGGRLVFALFGITLNAFRVGAGALLFLSAVRLVHGGGAPAAPDAGEDIAVVPLAMPVVVGPATTGALLVLGGEMSTAAERAAGCLALAVAVACLGLLLFLGSAVERALGRRGLSILSKVTGLFLAALAAQMVLTGVRDVVAGG